MTWWAWLLLGQLVGIAEGVVITIVSMYVRMMWEEKWYNGGEER